MADFVFGGIESDEQRLLQTERLARAGIRHFHAITPLDPMPGQTVRLTVQVGPDTAIDRLTAYVTLDGTLPDGAQGRAENGLAVSLAPVVTRWEPVIWDYVTVWGGEIPGQPEGTLVHYTIEGWRTYGPPLSAWSSEQNIDRTVQPRTLYGYHVDSYAPPQWAREAVVYQVFVDRFSGVENRWLEPGEMEHFAGGTLRGVIEHLDHIVALGATAIWLSPVFVTESYHGYDTSDYYNVDPRFGTNADLLVLFEAAHARGLRVILDFVANHTSVEFAPFVDALNHAESEYRRWFSFDPVYKHGYRAFFDVATMPQLDADHPAVRSFLNGAAQHWLEAGADGLRLDYAAGPSHAFWSSFRAACRQVKPDCWLFGEVTYAGEKLRTYTGRLDGCLDFGFCRAVRMVCAQPTPQLTLSQFATQMQASRAYFGDDFLFRRNEFAVVYDGDRADFAASYVYFAEDDTNEVLGPQPETNEFSIDARYRVHPNWEVRGLWRYDIASDSNLRAGAGITYGTQCAEFDLSVSRRFTSSDNVPPSTSIGFNVSLAGLGDSEDRSWPARVCLG